MFALMGGLFVYVDNTPSLQKAQIELYEVELLSVNTEENSAELSVSFMITNPSDTTFTVPRITYELYADGVLLGDGSYSEDISMPGGLIYQMPEEGLSSVFTESRSTSYSSI